MLCLISVLRLPIPSSDRDLQVIASGTFTWQRKIPRVDADSGSPMFGCTPSHGQMPCDSAG